MTLVWRDTLPEWKPLAEVDELKGEVRADPATGAPPVGEHPPQAGDSAAAGASAAATKDDEAEDAAAGQNGGSKKKRNKRKRESGNNWVYVTGLPPDITEDELAQEFAKCGVFRIDPATQKPRIKLYRDDHMIPKARTRLHRSLHGARWADRPPLRRAMRPFVSSSPPRWIWHWKLWTAPTCAGGLGAPVHALTLLTHSHVQEQAVGHTRTV